MKFSITINKVKHENLTMLQVDQLIRDNRIDGETPKRYKVDCFENGQFIRTITIKSHEVIS